MAGDGLERCRLCRKPVHAEDRQQHLRDHGFWEYLLFDWDNGSALERAWTLAAPIGLAIWLAYVIALLRDWLGIG